MLSFVEEALPPPENNGKKIRVQTPRTKVVLNKKTNSRGEQKRGGSRPTNFAVAKQNERANSRSTSSRQGSNRTGAAVDLPNQIVQNNIPFDDGFGSKDGPFTADKNYDEEMMR